MKTNPSSVPAHVPPAFWTKFGHHVSHVLAGFDRLRFRGTLRLLFDPKAMKVYLQVCHVLIKDFARFAESLTQRVKAAAYAAAEAARRPAQYLPSADLSKEDLAREIARRDRIQSGLVALFTAVEPCYSYSVRGDRQRKEIHLALELRKCTHLYHYYLHPDFGLCHVRVQTWFPFTVEVCLNGREWLARQMDRAGLRYTQRDNCFLRVSDPQQAQQLLESQLATDWCDVLNDLLNQAHPLHEEIGRPLSQRYYWTATQTEYATDLVFASPDALTPLYRPFVHHGIHSFGCKDLLRFLGYRKPGRFSGQVTSTLKHRVEGLRLRHGINGNSIKVYDKQGQILRVETTINHPEHFKVYRQPENQPEASLSWRKLRRGVADLRRRAQISDAANTRYLEALASVTGQTPLHQACARACRSITHDGRRYRPLNPLGPEDGQLLEILSLGELTLHGFRNRDLRQRLYPGRPTPQEDRRHAARLTRLLALLRAHGLVKKVPHTHRYHLTAQGRLIVTALLAARQASVDQLTQLAA
jgi:hypothetical protein